MFAYISDSARYIDVSAKEAFKLAKDGFFSISNASACRVFEIHRRYIDPHKFGKIRFCGNLQLSIRLYVKSIISGF